MEESHCKNLQKNISTITQASNPTNETLSQQMRALVISSYRIRPGFIITHLRANDGACSANTHFLFPINHITAFSWKPYPVGALVFPGPYLSTLCMSTE
jgi:hypothetical protein